LTGNASTPPPPNHPSSEEKRSLSNKPPVQHTYDAPREAKEEYLRSIENSANSEGSKNGGNGDLAAQSSQKKKKAKPKPPPKPKPTELKKNQRSSLGSQLQNSPIYRLMNGYTSTSTTPVADSQSSNSIPSSPSDDSESSFYQNIQIRSVPKTKANGMTSSRLSNSFTDASSHTRSSVPPRPSSETEPSLYENLSSYKRSRSDTPPTSAAPPQQPDGQRQQSMLYANLADFSTELENGRSNSTSSDNRRSGGSIPSSPSALASSSYTEVEIVHSVPPASPDSTAWSPPCSLSAGRQRDSALTSSIGSTGGCGQNQLQSSTTTEDGDVIYNDLNFALMTSLASMKRDKQTFADLLDRHTTTLARDSSGSKKKK
jgi:hypothetical protein